MKRELGSAGYEAGDGPSLVEVVRVAGLVTSEVEVAADIEVGRVVQLLKPELAAKLKRVAAADVGGHIAQVDRVVAHSVVEES